MFAHLNAPVPDARELRPVPDALAELAMAAMSKEPDDRIQSASELAERLLEAADTQSAPAGATLPAAPPVPEPPPTVVTPPPVAEPPVTEPAPTEPAPTEPAPTEPAPTQPAPTDRGRARRPRMGLLAGAVGAVVAAIVAVVVLSSGGSDDPASDSGSQQQSSTPTDQAPAPLDPTPLQPVELQPGADGVATGGGFVWIANRELNTVTRVKAQSRRVEGDPIRVGTEPDSLAEGLGGMWVTNTSDNSVTQLDLGSGKPLGTHAVGAAPEGIVIARGSAWVANGGDGTVTRLDSGGNSTATASVGSTPVQLAATSDAVWVTVSKENKIVELDLGSGQTTGRQVSIDGTPRGIAFEPSRGELWVSASAANQLVVVDPGEAKIVKRVDVPDDPREVRFGLWRHMGDEREGAAGHGGRFRQAQGHQERSDPRHDVRPGCGRGPRMGRRRERGSAAARPAALGAAVAVPALAVGDLLHPLQAVHAEGGAGGWGHAGQRVAAPDRARQAGSRCVSSAIELVATRLPWPEYRSLRRFFLPPYVERSGAGLATVSSASSTAWSTRSAPKRTTSSAGSPVSALGVGDRGAGGVLVEVRRVERDRRHPRRAAPGAATFSYAAISSFSGGIGRSG